jgi:hypothetical protein
MFGFILLVFIRRRRMRFWLYIVQIAAVYGIEVVQVNFDTGVGF